MEINTLNGDLRSTAVQLTAAAYKWTPSSFYKRSRLLRHFDNQVKGQEAHPNQLPSLSLKLTETQEERKRGEAKSPLEQATKLQVKVFV